MGPKWSDAGKQSSGWKPGPGGRVLRGPQADWKPTAGPAPDWTRRLQKLGLGAAAVAVVAAIVWAVLWLRPANPPVIVVVTADPAADALRLDAPIDPYGWLGGRRLKAWRDQFEARIPDNLKSQVPTVTGFADDPKDEAGLARLTAASAAASLARGPAKVVVLYFGLHAGADPDGPFLFGAGGQKYRLEPLFRELSDQLEGKQVVAVLDPGRLPPNPTLGLLADDFPRRLKGLNDFVRDGCPNLTVICGCSEGERGWESEEWQRTALALALVKGLDGAAVPAGQGSLLTAADLFRYVQAETRQWTGANRPTPQTPFLLPAEAAGQDRAEAVQLVPVAGTPAPVEDPPGRPFAEVERQLDPRWKEAERLADATPSPAVYTPRRWRRYRELLLRFERVARSGEGRAAEKLRAALEGEEKNLRDAGVKLDSCLDACLPLRPAVALTGTQVPNGVEVKLKSARQRYVGNPVRAGLDQFEAAYDEALGQADPKAVGPWFSAYLLGYLGENESTPPESIAPYAAMFRKAWADRPVRPAEVQLALLLAQFYGPPRGLVADPLPGAPAGRPVPVWLSALRARREAEAAAVGPPTGRHPYAEWVWPTARSEVHEGDAARRKAEDLLFAPAGEGKTYHEEAAKLLDDATNAYAGAKRRADQVRTALAVRDEVLADLPFLARWLAAEPTVGDDLFLTLVRVLNQAHALAAKLDRNPPAPADELARDADAVHAEYAELLAVYANKVKDQNLDQNQKSWWDRERLLDVPPLTGGAAALNRRAAFVRENRATTAALNKGTGVASASAGRRLPAGELANRLARLAIAELGREAADRQNQLGKVPIDQSALLKQADAVAGNDAWKAAADVGRRLADHFRELAKDPDPPAVAPADDRARAERFSRAAPAFGPADGKEPAQVNRDWRWRRLLAGLAHRAALDHWYDAEPVPYYRRVVDALLKDAAADGLAPPGSPASPVLGPNLGDLLPDGDEKLLADLRDAPALKLTGPPVDPPIRWTSERQKEVPFAVGKIDRGARPPDARPVVWAYSPDGLPAKVEWAGGADVRHPVEVRGTDAVPVPVTLDGANAPMEAERAIKLRQRAFFRGQVVEAPAEVRLSRAPDLVVTDAPPPPDDRPKVAFRGPDDLDLGAVSIVIDYSGSMGPLKQRASRISKSLDVLEKVLAKFPTGTKLSVRGFGVRGVGEPLPFEEYDAARRTRDELLTPPGYEVGWQAVPAQLRALMTGLRGVAQEEGGFSPIVRTMIHALGDVRTDADKPKLMIVLTDGTDNSRAGPNQTPPTDADVRVLRTELANRFRDTGVTPWVVLVADDRAMADAERPGVERVFGGLADLNPPGGIKVARLNAIDELARELADVLRPRVVVRPADRDKPVGVEVTLLPDERNYRWSDPLDAERDPDTFLGRLRLSPTGGDAAHELGRGDRLAVRLSNRGGGTHFEREVWGRTQPKGYRAERDGGRWLVSVPGFAVGSGGYEGEAARWGQRQSLDVVVAVEDVRGVDEKPTRHARPGFVWWDLEPAVPLRERGVPVYVYPEYRHPAPAWRLRRWDWAVAENARPEAKLRAWVADDHPDPLPETKPVTTSTGEWGGTTGDGRTWRATFGWEPHEFFRHPAPSTPDKRPRTLVVRVAFLDGKPADLPLFARVARADGSDWPRGAVIAEHRFFRAAGGYTGYFAGTEVTPDAADGGLLKVELFSVADVAGPGTPDPFAFKLPNPESNGRSLPKPVP